MRTLPIKLVLASLLTISLGVPGRASAALILVTSENDAVADDGRCSLREAVSAANRNKASGRKAGECPAGDRGFVDVIQLRRGTYQLKRLPIGEDQNLGGDLDVTESVIVQGKGQRTVIQNAIGDPETLGDGDRLFHVDPGAKGGVDVKFTKLTLARGDVGCSGNGCTTGGSAVDARGADALTFESCIVMRNTASCSGESCGSTFHGSPIQTIFGGALTIRDTTIKKNRTACSGDFCGIGGAALTMTSSGGVKLAPGPAAPAAFAIDDSTITQNESWCEGLGCRVGSIASVDASTIAVRRVAVTSNGALCSADGCATNDVLRLFADGASALADDVDVTDNHGSCTGDRCFLGSVLTLLGNGDATLRNARLRNNAFDCAGTECLLYIHYGIGAGMNATVEGVDVASDLLACRGSNCGIYGVLGGEAGAAMNVADLSLEDNQQRCEGSECGVGVAEGWRGAPLSSVRNQIARTISGCSGERCQVASLVELKSRGATSAGETTILSNLVACAGDSCRANDVLFTNVEDGALTLAKTTLEENTLGCGGDGCTTAALVAAAVTEALVLDQARLARNEVGCDGAKCEASGGVGTLEASRVTIASSEVAGNTVSCSGIGCEVPAVLRLTASAASISGSLLTDNASQCDGDDCAAGPGGALRNSAARLTIVDTTLTTNRTDGYGGAIFNDVGSELNLQRTLLSGNQAGLRGTMEFGGFGGAIYNAAKDTRKGVVTLIDSEISRNQALRNGGGILNGGTIASLVGSIVASNATGNCVNQGVGTGCP